MNLIEEIEEFLSQTVDGREMKRAIAVKMQLKGKSYHEIQELIGVSQSFISKWKNRAIFEGVDSLRVQYQGGKGKLAPQDKQAVIQWLTSQAI
jgi:putative transposase